MSSGTRVRLNVREGYARWAPIYTSAPNPMFSLEERTLTSLLPRVKGRSVVDLGCGTGRWLERFAKLQPAQLIGLDGSPEMLHEARTKNIEGARLIKEDCLNTTLADHSCDLILNSFVLSHISSISHFAKEIRRLLSENGSVFITDLHPETARELNWKRAFSTANEHIEIESTFRPINELLAAFESQGLRLRTLLEPAIGEPERWIFEHHGREDLFDAASSNPALLLMQFTADDSDNEIRHTLTGARIAISAEEAVASTVSISDSIERLSSRSNDASSIDLSDYLVLPGLINAHDHLDFALFPQLGRGGYRDAKEWALDIYRPDDSPIRELLQVPKDTRLLWGAVRNLLCGVTTVCHHDPQAPILSSPEFPVQVMSHTVWSHSLGFDSEFAIKHRELQDDQLFVIHLAEGVTEASRKELAKLDAAGALTERTVLIHGCALDADHLSQLAASGASLVWCPGSNTFLFGSTLRPQDLGGIRVALGSDSPLTSPGDLLDELRLAVSLGASEPEAFDLVTSRPSDIFQLKNGEGAIRPTHSADLIAIRDDGRTPAEQLCSADYSRVEMVFVKGKVNLASPTVYDRLPREVQSGMESLTVGDVQRWVRAPIAEMITNTLEALASGFSLSHRPISML